MRATEGDDAHGVHRLAALPQLGVADHFARTATRADVAPVAVAGPEAGMARRRAQEE
jgi:hypothetical protein